MSGTRLHTGMFSLAKGTRLNGIYEIDSFLASGGMGDIYKGHSIETGDAVAIKVMRHELAENTAALALFRKEASALHHLYNETIVRYFVFTVEPELKRPYLAMEFVEGEPLSTILKDGPLSFEAVWDLKNRLAQGLQAAHELGIFHRDVSPDNVLVPSRDVRKAKIIDFGIARSTRLDTTGTVVGSGFAGKYSYVSPEQLGMFGGDVTSKSDIYSLGLVLAECITGRLVDMGSSHFDSIERRRTVPDLRAIDGRLRPLLDRMLQPDPADRPASMSQVAETPPGNRTGFTQREETRPGTKLPRPLSSLPRRKGSRLPLVLAASALVVLGVAASGGYLLLAPSGPVAPPIPKLDVFGPTSTEEAKKITADSRPMLTPKEPRANPPVATPQAPTTTSPIADAGSKVVSAEPPAQPSKVQTLAPPPNVPSARDQQVADFVAQYKGGDCFFLLPVALNLPKPKIDGYGIAVEPFQAFDTAFARATNIEADIGVRQVMPAQCPALTFLSRLHGNVAAPKLELDSAELRRGEQLSGTLANFGTRHLAFLYVSETGTVHNLTSLLKPEGDLRRFKIPLTLSGPPGSQPQLLIALASEQPLEALRPAGSLDATSFFPPLLAEVQNKAAAVGATAMYFRLER